MTGVTLLNSKMNQPKYQEMGFFSSLHGFKRNLSEITAFRKLKCPDPSMIPLSAKSKNGLIDKLHTDLANSSVV